MTVKRLWILLLLLVLVGCGAQSQPLNMALLPEQIETLDLEKDVLSPRILPKPANGYQKQGLHAALCQGETVVATLEYCQADRRFPQIGSYLAEEYTLYCRLSDTWGVIVQSETIPQTDLITMVGSLDIVYGPPQP